MMSRFRPFRLLAGGLAIAATVAVAGASSALPATSASARVSDVVVVVDSAAVSRDGVLTLQGTVTCDETAQAYVEVDLSQRVGQRVAEGIGSSLMDCDVTPTPWTFRLTSSNEVSFKAGKATFNAFASAYSADGGFINFSAIDQPLKVMPAHG